MLHFFSVSVDLLFIIYPTTTTLGAFDFVSSIVFVFLVPLSHFQNVCFVQSSSYRLAIITGTRVHGRVVGVPHLKTNDM